MSDRFWPIADTWRSSTPYNARAGMLAAWTPDLALVPVHSVVPRLEAIRLLITGDRRADATGCASRDAAGGKTNSAF